MKPASSEARKTMPLAMSVTVPTRPIGMRLSLLGVLVDGPQT
jgi:hypothetical protein